MNIHNTNSYLLIQKYYNGLKTKRNAVPYMNHIDEGITILERLKASSEVMEAFAIHPILQNDDFFVKAFNNKDLQNINNNVVVLAQEYRYAANSYLSHDETFTYKDSILPDVRLMLIADKVQNRKDLYLYNKSHERFSELEEYFNNWLRYFQITESQYKKLIKNL